VIEVNQFPHWIFNPGRLPLLAQGRQLICPGLLSLVAFIAALNSNNAVGLTQRRKDAEAQRMKLRLNSEKPGHDSVTSCGDNPIRYLFASLR
jgi:hypothetical protein